MREVFGFDEACARAMWAAYETQEPVEAFLERARGVTAFFGLWMGDEPVGAALFDGPVFHVAVTRPGRAAFAIRRIVAYGLQHLPYLLAPVKVSNRAVCRLAEGLGFVIHAEADGRRIYRRDADGLR